MSTNSLNVTFVNDLLRRASMSKYGIRIICGGDESSPATRAKAAFYRARADSTDTDIRGVQIRLAPDDPNHCIWLLPRAVVRDDGSINPDGEYREYRPREPREPHSREQHLLRETKIFEW